MADQLGQLYAVADVREKRVLDVLAVRAGIGWKCPACPWTNRKGSETCGGCGRVEPDVWQELRVAQAPDGTITIQWRVA